MANTDSENNRAGIIKFLILLIAFVAIYLLCRLPWITSDPGIQSIWEYGYNATDEGYYLAGGKEKFLWGHFVDLSRHEAFTYGFSAGTHFLSYIAHLFGGLSTWSWRIPFASIYLAGWIAMFCYLSKKASALIAFALCTSISMVPMVIAYERTASNDALIGALLVLSFVCAAGKSPLRIIFSALIAGSIILIKPSVWILLPIIAAGIAQDRSLRNCIKDFALFFGVAIMSVFAWKLLAALMVLPEASSANISIWEIIKRTTTHYPLPSLFDFASHFKGISSFPRDPSIQLLGVIAPFILTIPMVVAAKMILAKRVTGNLLLFLCVPLYVAAVSVMNTIYTHYFIPIIVLLPIIFFSLSSEMEDMCVGEKKATIKELALPLVIIIALCAIGALFIASYTATPAQCQNFYSRIYNLPSKNVWAMTWQLMCVYMLIIICAISFIRGLKIKPIELVAWGAVAFISASVTFAPFPAAQLAPYIKKSSSEYFSPMMLTMIVSSLFLVLALGFKKSLQWKSIVAISVPVAILACYLATPNWRNSFCELIRPGTQYHEKAAKTLSALIPNDAIVIGERSNQMLMSLPIRTATTFASNSNPMPVIEEILKANPDAKLYALIDSQHSYNLQHYREHMNKYRLHHITTIKMPSFGNGTEADVYLTSIEVLKSNNAK